MAIIVVFLTDKKLSFTISLYFFFKILWPADLLASSSNQELCLNYLNSKKPYYDKLFTFYKTPDALPRNDVFLQLQRISQPACMLKSVQTKIITLLSRHSGKIGVLLPLSGPKREIGLHFEAAIRSFYKSNPARFKKTIVIMDSKGLPRPFHESLARLVFEEKVSILIGGATHQEARLLRLWSTHLEISSLILHEQTLRSPAAPYAFYVSPDQDQLSLTLTSYMRSQKYKRVAVFHPENHQLRFVKQINKHSRDNGIHVTHNFSYKPADFHSLESSVKELFRLDDPERAEELAELMAAKQESQEPATLPSPEEEYVVDDLESRTTQMPPTKKVFLPPIVNVDAIVLADHFKTLRHFVAILKYYKVPRLPLLGTQQWRAPEIFKPWEPYLSGSVFVDYIGSYRQLPYRLKVSSSDSEYLTSPSEAQVLDIWLIGRHGVDIADRILYFLPQDRRNINRILQKMPSRKNEHFFQSKQVFDSTHKSYWPTYLFTINGKSIYQLFSRPAESMKLIATPFH